MKSDRNKELAIIHIARKALGLDDETYRAMLHVCARVSSSGDLDCVGRAVVIAHLKQRGWKPSAPKVANFKSRLVWKVDQLLEALGLTRAYAEGIAKQMYKRQKLEWCNAKELRGIIAALVNKQKAEDGKNKNG